MTTMVEKKVRTITREAIHHIPKSNYSYGYDKETLHIRVKTKKGEVDKVTLRIGDPYIWDVGGPDGGNLNSGEGHWSGGQNVPMEKELETREFDHWFLAYKPLNKRARYAFILENDTEKILFGEKKTVELDGNKDMTKLCEIGNFFCFPYLCAMDVPEIPQWVKDTTWYQLFPDRFANGDQSIDPPGVEPWGSTPKLDNFNGGDLQGIIDHLDYLQELGISGLYFCPIFEARSNHRYDTINYFKVCPYLGDDETFRTLVKEAHKRGIKIMLDAVFNHLGWYSEQWQDVIKNNEQSRYKDWFHIHQFPVVDRPLEELDGRYLNYETFGRVATMPKVNTSNPEVVEFLLEVGRHWVREFDIDAWRLDVCNEVDHRFWRMFREEIRNIKDDVYILGEVWHDGMPWLQGDQFDAVMNYPLTDAITDFFCTNKIDAEEFKYAVNKVNISYPMQMNEVTFNLLDSHDTSRIITIAEGNKDKAKLSFLFMFTQAGSPCIYYGDEVGMEGLKGMNSELHRECMVWEEEKQDRNMFAFIQRLIALRNEEEAFKSTKNEWIETSETGVIVVKKEDVTILINNNEVAQTITVPVALVNKNVTELFTKTAVTLGETVELPAYGFMIVK